MANTQLDFRLEYLTNKGYVTEEVENHIMKNSIDNIFKSFEDNYVSLSSKQKTLEEQVNTYQTDLDSRKERYAKIQDIIKNGKKPRFWDRVFEKGYKNLERKLEKIAKKYEAQKAKADEYKSMLDSVKSITSGLADYNSLESAIATQKEAYASKLNPKCNSFRAIGSIIGAIAGFIGGAFSGPLAPFIWAGAGATMGYVAGDANAQTPQSLIEREKLTILKTIRSAYDNALQNAYSTVYYGGKIEGLTINEKPKEKETKTTTEKPIQKNPGKPSEEIMPSVPSYA